MPLERPYEKFEHFGPNNISDSELIAIMLRSGSKNIKATDLAQSILKINDGGLMNIVDLSCDDLKKIKGIGKTKAIQLKAIAEIHKRLLRTKAKERLKVRTPEAVADYIMPLMVNLDKECFRVLVLDSKLNITANEVVSVGTLDRLIIMPRDVFKVAVQKSAKSIIVVHNHPSGDPEPSENDIILTERLVSCGKILGINLDDHIIIGDHSYVSMREEEIVDF